MYFVDREKIEKQLQYIEAQAAIFESADHWTTPLEKLALERIGQVLIESVIDVGNAMIDGFIMRDPGSYEDIIDILLDEKVVGETEANHLKEVILYRKELVRNYTMLDHGELLSILQRNLDVLKDFPNQIRRYLDEELGPVSAFR